MNSVFKVLAIISFVIAALGLTAGIWSGYNLFTLSKEASQNRVITWHDNSGPFTQTFTDSKNVLWARLADGVQADQVAKPVCSVTTADGAQLEVKLENSKYRLEEDDTVIVGHVFPSATTNATVNCDTSAVAQVGISHVKDGSVATFFAIIFIPAGIALVVGLMAGVLFLIIGAITGKKAVRRY